MTIIIPAFNEEAYIGPMLDRAMSDPVCPGGGVDADCRPRQTSLRQRRTCVWVVSSVA